MSFGAISDSGAGECAGVSDNVVCLSSGSHYAGLGSSAGGTCCTGSDENCISVIKKWFVEDKSHSFGLFIWSNGAVVVGVFGSVGVSISVLSIENLFKFGC